MKVSQLTVAFGAEIAGVDLARSPALSTVSALLRVLDTHGVVIMRGQQLTLENFITFSRSLGDLAAPAAQHLARAGYPELMIYSNILENGQPIGHPDAGRHWQTNGAHLKTPHRATLQYAVEIPMKDGVPLGDTLFASNSAAYDALESGLRQQLHGMQAIHRGGVGRKNRATPYFADAGLSQIFRRGVEHPVVRSHPLTGRKCLYVNPASTSHIRGMNDHESDALLNQLYRHIAQPAFVYRHQWQVGDVVLWDNGSIQHRAESDYALPLRRLLYRTVVKGAPFY